jgi:adenylate cyclase
MQTTLAAMNDEGRRRGLPELRMGIALHIGPVVAGNIGSHDHVKYGVVGPAVNLLFRIQGLVSGDEILISDALVKRVAAMVDVGPARIETVKGPSEPITVYPLLALREGGGADADGAAAART